MTSPVYTGNGRCSSAVVNTSNTDATGATGTKATIFTAGTSGSVIASVNIKGIVAAGTEQAADTVRFFLYDGTTYWAFQEQQIAAGSGNVSVTVANANYVLALGISIPSGWSLCATTAVGGATASYHVQAFGADY